MPKKPKELKLIFEEGILKTPDGVPYEELAKTYDLPDPDMYNLLDFLDELKDKGIEKIEIIISQM